MKAMNAEGNIFITAREYLAACCEDESASNSFRNKILRGLPREYFIKYGLSLWCLGFCLLLCLSLADEIRTKENYKIGKVSSVIKEARVNQNFQNLEPLKFVS